MYGYTFYWNLPRNRIRLYSIYLVKKQYKMKNLCETRTQPKIGHTSKSWRPEAFHKKFQKSDFNFFFNFCMQMH